MKKIIDVGLHLKPTSSQRANTHHYKMYQYGNGIFKKKEKKKTKEVWGLSP